METLIIQGKSASKAKLLMKLAKEFDFSAFDHRSSIYKYFP
ncbi:MAG: hypothetical protein ACOC13_00175 [Tangfeifania sp.]